MSGTARALLAWSGDRFPLAGVALYAGTIHAVSVSYPAVAGGERPALAASLLGALVVALFLLRLRIVDEHRDFDADVLAHPDRVLSRGDLGLGHLRYLFVVALGLEVAICLWLGPAQTAVWCVALAWLGLMQAEFFVPDWLDAHLGWYLVTHQLLVPLLGLFGVAQGLRLGPATLAAMDSGALAGLGLFCLGLMCGTMTYEVARKTWNPGREHEAAPSYTRAWGRRRAVAAGWALAGTGTAAFGWLSASAGASPWPQIVVSAVLVAFVVAGARFLRRPDAARSKALELVGAAFTLTLFAGTTVAFLGA